MQDQPVLSWKAAGLLLGLLLIVATALVKPLGVSTQYVVTDAIVLHSAAPNLAESNEYLNSYGDSKLQPSGCAPSTLNLKQHLTFFVTFIYFESSSFYKL